MLLGQIEDEQKTSDLIDMGRKFGKLKKHEESISYCDEAIRIDSNSVQQKSANFDCESSDFFFVLVDIF